MGKGSVFETGLSFAIVLLAVCLFAYMRLQTGTFNLRTYSIDVTLPAMSKLDINADVRISGVRIGRVVRLALDRQTYRATVGIELREDLKIPVDSVFSVAGGLMSSAYLASKPGVSPQVIAPGNTWRSGPKLRSPSKKPRLSS